MKTATRPALLLAAAALTSSACLRPAAVAGLAEALAPGARALLGPEIGRVATLLQSAGAIAVERHFGALFAGARARAEAGGLADPAAIQAAHDKAGARMRLLERLRLGNDYSQIAQALGEADRDALEAARAETDGEYRAVRALLATLGANDPEA